MKYDRNEFDSVAQKSPKTLRRAAPIPTCLKVNLLKRGPFKRPEIEEKNMNAYKIPKKN